MKAENQTLTVYLSDEDKIIAQALAIIEKRAARPEAMTSPKIVGEFFTLRAYKLEHEVFSLAWLDSQNRLIEVEEISRGTLNQAAVYPREVVKSALARNAASVIFHHNHPSGLAKPSRADETLTEQLKKALALIDVRVLDHVITGGEEWYSFAENGLI